LFVYNAIDDFVMSNLATYSKRKIVSAEGRDIDLSDSTDKKDSKDKDAKEGDSASASELSEDEVKDLGDWMVKTMPTKLATVRATSRLASSPAIITEHESGSLRRMMRMVEQQNTGVASADLIPPQSLEINPKHALMVGLERLRKAEAADSSSADAELILGQIVDNALVTAGLMDDSRGMVTRVNALMLRLLEK
jgi:HSP90 family molecular chaperone